MSSFDRPHRLYLFSLTNGRKRLAYGTSPEDALEVLRSRSTDAEMAQVIPDRYITIAQTELRRYVSELG